DLERHEVDLGRLVDEVVELLRPQATTAHLSLEVDVASLPALSADAPKLRQVLVNLLLNAIQATPPEGTVRLVAAREHDDVCICVDDSGPGVPPEMRHRIFEPFFTTKDAGTGLGLPLVHAVVQQHGGTIALETSPAGGARFHIRFPLADNSAHP